MTKKILVLALCCMAFCLAACGPGSKKESGSQPETAQTVATAEDKAEPLTKEQALLAVKNYCFANNPDLESMVDSDEYNIEWEAAESEAGEIVVLFRSYTGSETRYYIDPVSGETYVTERVPGIIDEEERTEESFNVRDFLGE